MILINSPPFTIESNMVSQAIPPVLIHDSKNPSITLGFPMAGSLAACPSAAVAGHGAGRTGAEAAGAAVASWGSAVAMGIVGS